MVRAFLIGAMLVASTPAWADPSSNALQIRLIVVEGCSGDAGSNHCPAPHQRSDTPQLPPQVRELAPPVDNEDTTAAVTVIY
ncbi:hypothetical protein [Stenotrophomonas maltophilia]|uniref:hypothetical protein n=1 Tax=Stenotrophomonas maltophilia TaxID=40324 RepID=UPI003CCFE606